MIHNDVFNKLLEDLRKEILPKVISNWESLSLDDKSSLEEMGNFFCKVHPLVTSAEECNKILSNLSQQYWKAKVSLPCQKKVNQELFV